MIRDVNFFFFFFERERGRGGGWAKGGWHFVTSRRLSEQSGMVDAGEPLLNLLVARAPFAC